ncbi:MAG: DUF4351 domain-containing protein [Capsulimonadales bacterium]|nr:DUF4351 domain-containing protein [Capsulimonadales bacterium]
MPHDQLFKELLRAFFREFLELFLPEVAAQLRFDTVRFLEQEVFTDFPDGEARRADTLAETETLGGEEEIVLFHVEVEQQRRAVFRARMWQYYVLLTERTKKPVYPIAVYLSPGAGGIVTETHTRAVLGETIVTFRYRAVGLPDLSADDYLATGNLLGVALSATMRTSRVGALAQKWDAIRTILLSSLDDSRKILLSNVIETYLILDEADTIEYERRLRSAEPEVREMISVYEERARERFLHQGIEQGIEQGILIGQRNFVRRFLQGRFGPLPDSAEARLQALSAEELDRLSERLPAADSLSELGLTD